MRIPTFTDQPITSTEDGTATPYMRQLLDIMLQQMQLTLSNDGFVIPSQTTTAIQNIVTGNNPKGPGTIWYDTTLNQFVGNQNGVLVSFNTTPI
jgi:hypothetical protein